MKKKLLLLLAAVGMLLGCAGCKKEASQKVTLNVGVLKGPTGMGAVTMMDKAERGEYPDYKFTLTPDVTDIVARLSNGELQIGALPTNTAVNLYNKTNGEFEMIAVNTLGVLYILENGDTVHAISDLKGKTILVNGKGANPEFVINYVLKQNGLVPGEDVTLTFKEATDIVTAMASGQADLCMLPVPAATTVLKKNGSVREAIDMTEAYKAAAGDGSELTMGCLVAKKELLEKNPKAVQKFLADYEKETGEVLAKTEEAAALATKYGITANEAIAKEAIPKCNIVCITGPEMKQKLDGYYKVLFAASPDFLGGSLPKDDFYRTLK